MPQSSSATTQKFLAAGYVPPAWMGTQVGPQVGVPIQALQPKQAINTGPIAIGSGSNSSPAVTPPMPAQTGSSNPPLVATSTAPTVTAQHHAAGNVQAISAAQTALAKVPAIVASQLVSGTTSAAIKNLGQAVTQVIPSSQATAAQGTPAKNPAGLLGILALAGSVLGAFS